jgi:hypothetical protein
MKYISDKSYRSVRYFMLCANVFYGESFLREVIKFGWSLTLSRVLLDQYRSKLSSSGNF